MFQFLTPAFRSAGLLLRGVDVVLLVVRHPSCVRLAEPCSRLLTDVERLHTVVHARWNSFNWNHGCVVWLGLYVGLRACNVDLASTVGDFFKEVIHYFWFLHFFFLDFHKEGLMLLSLNPDEYLFDHI